MFGLHESANCACDRLERSVTVGEKNRVLRVAVAGTIGAGKTSLVAWLVKRYNLEPFYEPNEQNPFLDDFYADMSRWAFHSQAFFLAHKLELHQRLETCPRSAVIDRTIYEDAEIFARNLHEQRHMSTRDWEVYCRLYEGIRRSLQPPDVLIALTCSVLVRQ